MKKNISILSTVVCTFILMLSCYKNDVFKPSNTLAGSIDQSNYIKEAKGSWGDMPLENIIFGSRLDVGEKSATEVSLFCYFHYEEVEFRISIYTLPLLGVRYDVKFDYSGIASEIHLNDTEFTDIPCEVKGWMKKKDSAETIPSSRTTPATFYYSCDITIDCTIDGKKLHLQVTSIIPG